jgi:hypothetical protein
LRRILVIDPEERVSAHECVRYCLWLYVLYHRVPQRFVHILYNTYRLASVKIRLWLFIKGLGISVE